MHTLEDEISILLEGDIGVRSEDQFFRAVADLNAPGRPELAQVADLAARHQPASAEPDWLPDVIARCGHPTPGA